MQLDQEKCGLDALIFFKENIEAISNSLIHRHCTNFAFSCSQKVDYTSKRITVDKLSSKAGGESVRGTSASASNQVESTSPIYRLLFIVFTLYHVFTWIVINHSHHRLSVHSSIVSCVQFARRCIEWSLDKFTRHISCPSETICLLFNLLW